MLTVNHLAFAFSKIAKTNKLIIKTVGDELGSWHLLN